MLEVLVQNTFLPSGGGYPIFPPLVLEQALLQMRLQHAFLLLVNLTGEVKLLNLQLRSCVLRASLTDLCEPSLVQLDDALQLGADGQLTLQVPGRPKLCFDNALQLWIEDGEKKALGHNWMAVMLSIVRLFPKRSVCYDLLRSFSQHDLRFWVPIQRDVFSSQMVMSFDLSSWGLSWDEQIFGSVSHRKPLEAV